jgi:hypothetical protein
MMKKIVLFFLFLIPLCGEEIDLSLYEKSLYSQNGEDGVLAKIFQVIAPSSKFCVEFGAYDGITGSNTYLLRIQGWDCVQFDRLYQIPQQNVYKEFITAETINEIFERHNVPRNLDLLSIDIDYNDFYVWKAIDEKYRPAVVLIEYNSTHLPDEDKVVRYRPYYVGDDTNYYGASILALYRLGRAKGYSLVYADANGVNLFFVRDDLITENIHFKEINQVDKLYRRPTYGKGPNGGHPEDYKQRCYLSSEEVLR